MITKKNAQTDATFLDMQADAGVTKHIGGFEATETTAEIDCHKHTTNPGCHQTRHCAVRGWRGDT
jgi:hypothetical protein